MNKVILITGASSGIGESTAKLLIQEGHNVFVAARRLEKMNELKNLGAIPIKMDITKEEDIQNTVKLIKNSVGRIDVLINNAGYAVYGAVEDTDIEDARRQFEVNLFGLASLTQKLLPLMRQNNSGTIINISSVGGKIYTPLGAWYHATKHALEGWSDCLRIELAQFGINVVVVEPGIIKTEFGEVMTMPSMKRSGNGPYANLAHAMEKLAMDSYNKPKASSPPLVIAKVISNAINSNKPKTRYVAGKMAKPMLFMRKWFSDKTFDRIIMNRVK